MEKKRHFVLVHGAGHGAWCWYKVVALLKSAGNRVTTLDLAASGVHPKQVNDIHSLSDYIEPLMKFMKSLSPGEKVIIVGHSMGGLSISAAIERFPQKISAAVFAAAFMPGPDLSYINIIDELNKQGVSYMDSQVTFDNGANNPPTSILLGPNFLSTLLYQLSPAEDLVLATLLVRPVVFHFADDPMGAGEFTNENYGSVPRIYIVCDRDNIVKEEIQRWMISENPTTEVKVIAGSDHMVMFSKPKELSSCLEDIGNRYL